MRTIVIVVVSVLLVACKDQKSEPAKQVEPTPAPAPSAPAPADVAAAPAQPASLENLVFEANRVGSISNKTKLELAELQRLFPSAVVEKKTEEGGEGETSVSLVVKNGTTPLFAVHPDISLIYVLDASLKDPKGIKLGSTYEELVVAYSDAKCERVRSEGGEEGMGPSDTISCEVPAMKGVMYTFDISKAKKPKKLAAAKAAAGAKLSGISVQLTP